MSETVNYVITLYTKWPPAGTIPSGAAFAAPPPLFKGEAFGRARWPAPTRRTASVGVGAAILMSIYFHLSGPVDGRVFFCFDTEL